MNSTHPPLGSGATGAAESPPVSESPVVPNTEPAPSGSTSEAAPSGTGSGGPPPPAAPPSEGLFTGLRHGLWGVVDAVPYLWKNKTLWPWVVAPGLMYLLTCTVALVVFAYYQQPVRDMVWAWSSPTDWVGWLMIAPWFVVTVLVGLLFLASLLAGAVIAASVGASPFLDTLSQKVDEIELGEPLTEGFEFSVFMKDTARGVTDELLKALIWLGIQILLLVLWLIPGFGAVLHAIAATVVTWIFLAFAAWDPALARRRLDLKERVGAVRNHLGRALGYGAAMSGLLLIPIVNLVAVPIGVIAGTRAALQLPGLPLSNMQRFLAEKKEADPDRIQGFGQSITRIAAPKAPRKGPK